MPERDGFLPPADGHARLPFASEARPVPRLAGTTMRPSRSDSQHYPGRIEEG